MVENTVKKDSKGGPTIPRSLLMIAGGIFLSLVFSVYWRINRAHDFLGNGTVPIPEITKIDKGLDGLEDIMKQTQRQTETSTEPYKSYTTPDGYLSIKYPSSFTDGKSVIEELAGNDLESTNYLFYAYRMSQLSSDMQTITLTASRYDATSTEDVAAQIKKALDRQQCQSEINESETIDSNTAYRLFDSTYKCGGQNDANLWQARTAIVNKNDNEFYAITGTSASKNWESAKLDINSILDSITISQPETEIIQEQPETVGENNKLENNETEN